MGSSASTPEEVIPGSIEIPDTADLENGLGAIHRHPSFRDTLRSTYYEDVTTVYDAWRRGVKLSHDQPCMGHRAVSTDEDGEVQFGEFGWMTYDEVDNLVSAIGSAMVTRNLMRELEGDVSPATGNPLRPVGIYSKNRYEWVVVQHACGAYGGAVVPLYDTLGAESTAYILNLTELSTVFCSASEVQTLITVKGERAEEAAHLNTVVCFEDPTAEQVEAAAAVDIELLGFAALIREGQEAPLEPRPPQPGDVAIIQFTSGTTGNPKGAMLTHGSIIACVTGAILGGVSLVQSDRHLSYLPLAHIFETLVECTCWMTGCRVGFYNGNTLKLIDDIKTLKPTIFPSVPRLYNKIFDKIQAGIAAKGGLAATLFSRGLASKKYHLNESNALLHGFWDRIIMNKVAAGLGLGDCRLMITGSAPIAPHVMEFLRVVFSCVVIEGYGQTECSGASTLTSPNVQNSLGHVGGPMGCAEVRLESVEDLGYLVTDTEHKGVPCRGRGEILFNGPHLFSGYFRNPEKTAAAIDEDGWLHSGDIGVWNLDGNLRIVDRKKAILKLSQGEYVSPDSIATEICRSPLVAQAFVHGDSLQSCLVAVFVPDVDGVAAWGAANGREGLTVEEACTSEEFRAAVDASVRERYAAAKLKGFEKPKAFVLSAELFSVENGLLTPTFKLKRNVARDYFQTQIDEMYASGIGVVAGMAGLRQGEGAAAGAAAGAGK